MSDTAKDKQPQAVVAPAPRRRRGLFFWLSIVVLVVLVLPVLFYLGALAYVSWGFLNNSITQRIAAVFEAPVRIGDVRTEWLKNLKVENIAVEAPDKSTPITVDAVKLDWDMGPFLQENRVRSVTVQRPQVTLRRDAQGHWNIHLNLPGKSAYRVEQIIMREGTLAIEWPESRASAAGAPQIARLQLQALSGTYADQGPLSPKPFSLYGVFDSLETLSVNGTLGPGPGWVCRVYGGIHLDRDLASVFPVAPGAAPKPEDRIRGHVRYDISGRGEAGPDAAGRGSADFSGQFILEEFHWPLTAALAVDAPAKTLDVLGKVRLEADPDLLAGFDRLQLRVDGVGSLAGKAQLPVKPELHATLDSVAGTIDAEALNQLFQPRLWGEGVTLKGSVKLSELKATLPLAVDAPRFALATKFATSGARVAFHSVGELPLCEAAGTLEWPALKNTTVTVGDVGTVVFSLTDVYPAGGSFWLALATGATVHDLSLDIGRFWESEVGRRILAGVFDASQPVPAVSELPYMLRGRVVGKDLKLLVEKSSVPLPPLARPATRVVLNGIRVEDAEIRKWPFSFHLPARKFQGALDLSANLAGNVVQAVHVDGNLLVPGTLGQPGIALEFEQTYEPQAAGNKMGPVTIKSMLVRLDQLEQIFELQKTTGFGGRGMLNVTDTVFDPATGSAKGTIEADGVTLNVPLPRAVQETILNVLKVTRFAAAAPMFESNPTEMVELRDVRARVTAEVKDRRLKLQGRTQPIEVHADLPSVGDRKLYTLPALDFALDFDMSSGREPRSHALRLTLENGTKLDVALQQAPSEGGAGDVWTAKGNLESQVWGGIAATFDAALDLGQRLMGPVAVRVKRLDLAKVDALQAEAGLQQLGGVIENAEFKLEQYSLKALAPPKKWEFNGSLTGVQLSVAQAELARLTGEVGVAANSSGDAINVNAVMRLKSYEALLGGGAFYIPPPARDRTGQFSLRARYTKREKGADIRLDLLQADLGGEISLDTAGTLALAGTGLTKVDLDSLKLRVPDLAQARRTFGPANLENRAPWFGDIGLAGAGRFDGQFSWDASGALALQGRLGFENSTVTLGQTAAFTARDLNGEVPVMIGVQGWGAPEQKPEAAGQAPELRGELTLGPLAYAGLSAQKQKLELVATPNSLALATPLKLQTPVGPAVIEGLACTNLLAADDQSRITFRTRIGVEVDRVLRENGLTIAGIEGLVLTGQPLACEVRKTAGLRGPWEFVTTGTLRGPFFGGEMAVEKLNARGLFGPAPVCGGELRLSGPEGIRLAAFTEKNPRFGKVALRANAAVTGFETTSAALDGIQAFALQVRSVDVKGQEYYYDGRFAMAVAPEMMRAAFPRFLYSDEFLNSDEVRKLQFGVEKVGLGLKLQDGYLYGPIPLLEGGYIITAYGAEGIGILLGQRIKHGVKGDPEHKVLWADLVTQFQRATGK